jgi:hypothetical protein
MSWVNDARDKMIAAGVPPEQAAATAQFMQNAGYSAADVERGMGETAALFSTKPAEEIRAATGYQGHIPNQIISPGPAGVVDVARSVTFNPDGNIAPSRKDTSLKIEDNMFKQDAKFYNLMERKAAPTVQTPPSPAASPFRGVYTSTVSSVAPAPSIIKTPERFLSTFQEDITAQSLEKLLFENIGGIELASIIRHDTVEGTNPYYKIISNLSRIKVQLDPITLISRQRSGLTPGDFGRQIALFTKIPLSEYLQDIGAQNYIFIDDDDASPTYGSLIIELINLDGDEFVEVEIATSGTIYEVDI